jgi:hypothetical protein
VVSATDPHGDSAVTTRLVFQCQTFACEKWENVSYANLLRPLASKAAGVSGHTSLPFLCLHCVVT